MSRVTRTTKSNAPRAARNPGVRSVEVVNNAAFMVIFPLSFVANTFVPAEDLPGPLHQPADLEDVAQRKVSRKRVGGGVKPREHGCRVKNDILPHDDQ